MDAQYQKLLDLAPYGPTDYQRWESAKQSLRDNPPSSTGQLIKAGTPQAWELDPIPVVLDSQEWESFAGALSQRMRLIDLLLQDVYGPQRWIAEGKMAPVDPEHLLYMLWATTQHYADFGHQIETLNAGPLSDADWQKATDSVKTMILRGIGAL